MLKKFNASTTAAPAATAPAAAEPVVTETTTVAEATAAPVAETTAAAPATAKAEKPAKAAAVKAEKPAAAPKTLGGTKAAFQVQFPAKKGGRIAVDSAQELFFQYLQTNAAELGFTVETKALAVKLMNLPFQFLFGTDEVKAPEEIATKGGLLQHFEVKLLDGVHFKHDNVDDRVYRNPRSDKPENAFSRVQNRKAVKLRVTLDEGTVSYQASSK